MPWMSLFLGFFCRFATEACYWFLHGGEKVINGLINAPALGNSLPANRMSYSGKAGDTVK